MKFVSTVLVLLLTGMPLSTGGDQPIVEKPKAPQYHYVEKTIPFEALSLDQVPAEISRWAEPLAKKKSTGIKSHGRFTYLLVSAGQKPTGGWRVSVLNVQRSFGFTRVAAEIVPPGPDEMVTQAEAYPFQIVRVRKLNHRVSFTVIDRSSPGQGGNATPKPSGKGVTAKVSFENVDIQNAPQTIVTWVESHGTNAIKASKTEGAYTYILVSDGMKPTGGYSVTVTDISVVNQQVVVKSKVTSPAPGDIVTMALTHPKALVRIAKTELPVIIQVAP
jgi:hypothetical protein